MVDFKDEISLFKACQNVDIVIHNAGITRAKIEQDFFEVNTHATKRLVKAAIRAGVSRFVFISSLEARGPDGFSQPQSAYGRSKLEAEHILSSLNNDIEVVLLRPAGVYGPRDTDLLTLFQMAKYGFLTVPAKGGKLQPVHGRDVAEAVTATLQTTARLGPFEIASPEVYSWSEMVMAMEFAMQRKLKVIVVPKEVFLAAGYVSEGASRFLKIAPQLDRRRSRSLAYYSYTCKTEPFKQAYGWQAKISLREGLSETAQWYKNNQWL